MSELRLRREWLGWPSMLDSMGGVTAAVVLTASTAFVAMPQADQPHTRALGAAGYLLVALSGAALACCARAPTGTFAVTLGLGLVYQAAGYPGGPEPLPIVIALFSIAARGGRQRSLGLGLVATILLIGVRSAAVVNGFASPLLVVFPTLVVAALYAGQVIAGRHARHREAAQRAAEAAQRAAEAERAREQEMRRHVDAERLRIARELHDVVAHSISLINVQATMGVHLMAERPAEAAAALAAIKQASRQALRELRRILQVLRQADEDEPTAPVPGLAELDPMVAGARSAGLPVDVQVLGSRRPLPATVDVAAYRIIQESLTNALRYADSADTRVTLDYQATSLTVEIVSDGSGVPGPPAGSGHGIAGMRERATAVGGTLQAGLVSGGGFIVRADLPLLAELP